MSEQDEGSANSEGTHEASQGQDAQERGSRKHERLNLLRNPNREYDKVPIRWAQLEDWQKAMVLRWFLGILVVGIIVILLPCLYLHADKVYQDTYWQEGTTPNPDKIAFAEQIADEHGATKVTVGTYLENVKTVSLKESYFTADFTVWFRWTDPDPDDGEDLDMADNFRIYKGYIDRIKVVEDYTNGSDRYQLVRVRATVTRQFHTTRFPLESLQIRIYLESAYTADKVLFVADTANTTYNTDLSVAGYDFTRFSSTVTAHKYVTNEDNPELASDETPVTSEYLTAAEMNRNGWGLYFLCFIAMYGTSVWVLISLYLSSHHSVDPIGMIPGALFGTVSNVMVGAAMLPSSLDLGLLLFMNAFGIITILICTLVIIWTNRIRSNSGRPADPAFAQYYGTTLFRLILCLVIVGNVMIPISAYFVL